MAFDGTDVKQLATIPMADALPAPAVQPVLTCASGLTPTWSPAGDWLSFVSALDCDGVIFVLRADGSGLTRLAEGQRASWAPVGTMLAYDLNSPYCGGPPCGDGPWDLFTVRLPGGQPLRITHGEGFDRSINPRWSPDHGQIAFTRWDEPTAPDAYIIGADGTGERRLSVGSVVDWLADGSGVYVSRTRADYSGEDLFLVGLNGSERPVQRVSTDLSPDRTWMMFSQADPVTGEFSRILARVDGTKEVRLPVEWTVQGWSADGQTLLVSARDPSGSFVNLMAADLSTGALITIRSFAWNELAEFGGFAVQPILVNDLN